MPEIGAFEAKNKFGQLLDRTERGEEITITRHGRPVAKLVPAERGFDRMKAKRVAAELREISLELTLGSFDIKALVDEGRP